MLPKPLDKIDASDILALVSNQDEERRTLDFKRELPGNSDADKRELRADVASFANAAGGDLVFGVAESGGVARDVPGLPGTDPDTEIRRIEQAIQSGIDPRIPGVESTTVPIPGKGPVIVVRVQKSWRGPHLVKINDTFRMYGRTSKGKYILDATEIRSAYALSEQIGDRMCRWRDDRLVKILGRETPVGLADEPCLVIHLVPVSSLIGGHELSAVRLKEQRNQFAPPDYQATDFHINIDGVVSYIGWQHKAESSFAYCQVYRQGMVEGVSAMIVTDEDGRRNVASVLLEKMMIQSVSNYLNGLKELGIEPPFAVLSALLDMNGVTLAVGRRQRLIRQGKFDRDVLVLPDVLVESFADEVPTIMKPVFDAMWNAAGWEYSFSYTKDGKWEPQC